MARVVALEPTMGDARELDRSNLVYHEAQDRMALLPNYYAWIARRFQDSVRGTVLELGCGAGMVLEHYLPRCDKVVAVDVNPELLRTLAARFAGGKVDARQADLRGDWRELADVRADVAVALDVVEHFEDDDAFVEKLKARLAPGGTAVIKVPAQSRLYGAMDKASGHWRRYDAASLRALFERHGFATRALRPMNPVGAWGYRLKKDRETNYSKTFSPAKLKLVNAAIPVLALFDHLPGLDGLSLVGIFDLKS